MPKEKQLRPRLIPILSVLLILQSPILIFLGINLLTNRWSFLTSWPHFWSEFRMAFELVLQTPGVHTSNEVLLYDVLMFTVLEVSAAVSLLAGLAFYRGRPIAWMLGLVAQIGALSAGLVLFVLNRTPLAYWLLVLGIIMVMYLNYGDVRQWFLQPEENLEEGAHV